MWRPTGVKCEKREKFIKILRDKYKAKIGDYWDFHKWSVEYLEEFWTEIWDFTEIIYSRKFDKVIDLNIPMNDIPRWFEGAKLNFAENLLRNRDDRTALILTGEDRETRRMTYAEMYETAKLYAASFRKFRIKKGDRIASYISNREEPVFAMLGAVSLGAIWTGALPLIGAEAALNRLKQVQPRILITIDRFRNNGEEIEMLDKVKEIAEKLPSLEKVIIVPSKKESKLKDISGIKNSCFLDEFLQLGFEKDGSISPMVFEQVSFSHPVFINYTSGTTGLPKVLIHGCGGLLTTAKEHYLNRDRDLGKQINLLLMSPAGWVSWNIFISYIYTGITIIVFEGVPYFLSPTYLWDLVDKYQISTLFFTPSILDELEKRNYVPTSKHSLESLELFISGGSIVKPNNYEFVYNKVKKDIIFTSSYASTELMGSCMIFDRTLPIYRGEISCPSLAIDLACVDDSGNSVLGEVGELVIKKPTPSLPLGLWGDSDASRYKQAYFSKYSRKFAFDDLAIINPVTKGIIILCRSDETLKPKGCRFGSSEIYNIVNFLPEIRDSLCVSQYSKNRNERAVLFVQMKDGYCFNQKLIERIKSEIKSGLSVRHVPELILETKDIPHNLTGKKMEIVVKKIINNMLYNVETVTNPESLENFRKIPPYED
ncbi:acetoacetyl-CoA synthetase-like [Argiope bruennichi]|uniref:acetoacetyl-CoA synthetase-like n=1 Tax=Argiope bruennichi TaxID=94029 RepID=UPI0024941B8C|nr:acetoacetyl-CoA synthetase-like [Argiope bruennichi]